MKNYPSIATAAEAAAAWMFSEAAYNTTYGAWLFEWDELSRFGPLDRDELSGQLMTAGDLWLLDATFTDEGIDLTVSDYYTVDEPDDGMDEDEFEKAWRRAAKCRVYSTVADDGLYSEMARRMTADVISAANCEPGSTKGAYLMGRVKGQTEMLTMFVCDEHPNLDYDLCHELLIDLVVSLATTAAKLTLV